MLGKRWSHTIYIIHAIIMMMVEMSRYTQTKPSYVAAAACVTADGTTTDDERRRAATIATVPP
jgi:hypothetical protein